MAERVRSWCVAINFADVEKLNIEVARLDIEQKLLQANSSDEVTVKGQFERSRYGVAHYQLLVRFVHTKTITAAKMAMSRMMGGYNENYLHFEACSSLEAQSKYVVKRENGLLANERPWTIGADTEMGAEKRAQTLSLKRLMGACEDGKPEDFLAIVKEEMPRTYLFNRGQVNRAMRENFQEESKAKRYTDFNRPFLRLPTQEDEYPKSWLLVGKSGTGKTKFAMAHFKNPLLVSIKEDWGKLGNSEYDGAVIDDMAFDQWTPQNVIKVVDVAEDRTVDIKYGSARIPAYMPRIFTLNDIDRFYPKRCKPEERRAIDRRVNVVYINTHLFAKKDCEIAACGCNGKEPVVSAINKWHTVSATPPKVFKSCVDMIDDAVRETTASGVRVGFKDSLNQAIQEASDDDERDGLIDLYEKTYGSA